MKKNKMMRIASVLLVAVLLSTCAISGTFAKYTEQKTASDSARVAKWGVSVSVGTDEDKDVFDKTYAVDTAGVITTTVSSEDKVVAPGTSGSIQFAISGKPEVATQVTVDPVGTWKDICLPASVSNAAEDYNPVKFSLTKDGTEVPNAKDISLDAMKSVLDGLDAYYEPNSDSLAATYVLSWVWEFGDGPNDPNDVYDTFLGNAAINAVDNVITEISFSFAIRVDQVD